MKFRRITPDERLTRVVTKMLERDFKEKIPKFYVVSMTASRDLTYSDSDLSICLLIRNVEQNA